MYFLSREVTRRWTSDSMRAFSASVWFVVVYVAVLAERIWLLLELLELDELLLFVGGGTYLIIQIGGEGEYFLLVVQF